MNQCMGFNLHTSDPWPIYEKCDKKCDYENRTTLSSPFL